MLQTGNNKLDFGVKLSFFLLFPDIFTFKGKIMKYINLKDTIIEVVFIFDAMF